MKGYLLFPVLIFLSVITIAQPNKLSLPQQFKNIIKPFSQGRDASYLSLVKQANKLAEFNWPQEITIGSTYFDVQSERSAPAGRIAIFNDQTLGVVWTCARDTVDLNDKGTSYTYFDGSVWSSYPSVRIESVPAISPTIAMWGSGESVCSAQPAGGPLIMCSRPAKGIGQWLESFLPVPAGATGLKTPKMVTNGLNHSFIHILSLTTPVSEGGSSYHGQDGALVYQRSMDGGANWQINGFVPAAMDSSVYNGFSPDTYAFAEPQGNKLAFVVGDSWSDLFLLKSADNGNSWQKTIIWQHPYPQWNGEATDTIYCPDGAVHLAFDDSGNIHVVFGITRLFSDGSQVYRFPFIGGIGHWEEGLPTWTNGNLANSLNPDSLEAQGRLACSYLMDWNANGTLDFLWNFSEYNVGPISFPQIAFDQYGVGLLVMSSVRESYNDDLQDYRHIWYKYLYFGELGNIVFDWNDQPQHLFHEGVYPSLGARSPDLLGWPFCYQLDGLPGMAAVGDMDPYTENLINKVDIQYMLPPIFVSVALVADPADGGAVTGECSVVRGSSVTIEAHANPGWEFLNWTSQGVVFSSDTVFTFDAIWNYNLVAHFRLLEHVDELYTQSIAVSPNPARESLTIHFPDTWSGKQMEVQIMSIYGKQVMALSGEFHQEELIDISGLIPGIYLLRIQSPSGKMLLERVIVF